MQDCLSKKQKRNKHIYCMHSFKLVVFITNDLEERNYQDIIARFENDDKLKMYNVCYWLSGRKMSYKVYFRYNKDKNFKWNIVKYRNYLRLKVRLKEL